MNKKYIYLIISGLLAVALLILTVGGCSEKIVNTQPQSVGVTFQAKISSPAMVQAIDHILVIVAARDIAGIIIDTLEYADGFIVGEVVVPAGRDRVFVITVMDIDGNALYAGETVIDVNPDSRSMLLNIILYPAASMVYFKPHYQERIMNDEFTMDVYINLVPGISSIFLAFGQNSAPAYIDSITIGSSLIPANTTFESWQGDFLYYADISYSGDVSGSLTDAIGNAHLATIYFNSYADWQYDTATVVLTPEIRGMWDISGDSMITAVYTDNAEVFLTRPLISK